MAALFCLLCSLPAPTTFASTAAVRIALPDANADYYLVASLGITFPYNVLLGIPLYQKFATWLGAG